MERRRKHRAGRCLLKDKTSAVLAAATAVFACAAIAACAKVSRLQKGDGFLPGTYVNGTDISGLTPYEAAAVITDGLENRRVAVLEDGNEVFTESLSGIGFHPDSAGLEKELTDACRSGKGSFIDTVSWCLKGRSFTYEVQWTADGKTLRNAFTAESLTVPRKKGKDAKIEYNREKVLFQIHPETPGTEVSDEALCSWLEGEVRKSLEGAHGIPDGPITATIPGTLYKKPERTSDDAGLKKKLDALNRCAGGSITYVFGDKTEPLPRSEAAGWLYLKKGKPAVHMSRVREYVASLAEKYDTRYLDRVFTATGGYTVNIPAGLNEYGYTIDQEREVQQLASDILSGASIEREPAYIDANIWGNPYHLIRSGKDDLAGTYVEVSLSSQHMWYYRGGSLIIESDVVTGDVTKGLGTASGVFPLAYKESPSVLRGGTGKDRYETPVQYWMPFYEGQGLHDANWKTVFGGTQYMGNGSHGCVNLPPSVAAVVYENIELGTAIVIY